MTDLILGLVSAAALLTIWAVSRRSSRPARVDQVLAGWQERERLLAEEARRCPACPHEREWHDGWGCRVCSCEVPIAGLSLIGAPRG